MANNGTKTCDGCGHDSEFQLAWLIEGDGCYWDGKNLGARGFTRNVNDALQFVRKQDADVIRYHLMEAASFALRTTQHAWVNGTHRE
jgi:hypothetical protein